MTGPLEADALAIRRVDLASAEASALISALNAELSERYPEQGATHFRLDPDEVAPGQGVFLVASLAGQAVACGAVRRIDRGVVEIKRMYVAPDMRRRGIAHTMLTRLEAEARGLGARRLVLETGGRQPEALALYRRFGYATIPAYAEYADSPLSICLGKQLGDE